MFYHNQLLLTKFGRILQYWTDDVKNAAMLQIYWTVNREDLGMRLCFFGSDTKMAESFTGFTKKK